MKFLNKNIVVFMLSLVAVSFAGATATATTNTVKRWE